MPGAPRWDFHPYQRWHVRQDPVQTEFFTSDNVQALVRETIQNSLDARLSPAQPVRVRFGFVTVAPRDYLPYLYGLIPHLRAALPERELPDFSQPLKFLIIEDFNTRGLAGDPTVDTDEQAEDNDFYYFWRNVGRTEKREEERGRWGLGKTVFHKVSRINTFFGITLPHGAQQMALLGLSVLRSHDIGDGIDSLIAPYGFMPYGYYGRFDDDHFALPITDELSTGSFCRTFHVLRHRQRASGLSLAIAAPYDEITIEGLTLAAIEQFFYPILDGSLEIAIHEGYDIIRLTRAELGNELSRLSILEPRQRERYERLFAFARWAIDLDPGDYIVLPPAPLGRAPDWRVDQALDAPLERAARQFQSAGRVALRVPVKVQMRGQPPRQGWFKAYLGRDETLMRGEDHFIREGIALTAIRSLTQPGLRGLVVIDEAPLTTMLGDAENPSHTDWHRDSLQFRDRYEHGPSTISFVKRSLRELAARILAVRKGVNKDLLRDVFIIPPTERRPAASRSRPERLPDPPPDLPELERHEAPVQVTCTAGVVRITGSPAHRPPERVTVELAYDVRAGDPFRQHSAADFDLRSGAIAIDGQGVTVEAHEINRLTFTVLQADFYVAFSGFHAGRDLAVRLRWDG
ncbi:MAG: hypothetical protein ACUVS2_02040 [Candidatus Flexifilum sp.]